MTQYLLAAFKASENDKWRSLLASLRSVDYERWKKRSCITSLEFVYLLAGFEPLPDALLCKTVVALRNILFNISRKVSFKDIFSHDKGFWSLLTEFKIKYPDAKTEAELIDKIIEQASLLLDIMEVVYRAITTISSEHDSYFSQPQEGSREKLWRFDFLVYWLKNETSIVVPEAIGDVDHQFDLQKELLANLDSSESNLRRLFGNHEIMKDGLIDVRKIMSTKLLLSIESYVINMHGKEINKIPSSASVEDELIKKYGTCGVTVSIARGISENSRHDARGKVSLNNAREKTIFFQ